MRKQNLVFNAVPLDDDVERNGRKLESRELARLWAGLPECHDEH